MPCSPCLLGTALTKRTAESRCSPPSFVCWTRLLLPPVPRGRGKRGGRGNFPSLLPHASLVAALVVDNGSGMLQAGFLSSRSVPFLSTGPSSSAHWLVRTTCTRSLFLAVACARLVFLVHALRYVRFGFWQARDARHHGRYGPEGGLRRAVQKTAENPQLQFIKVAEADPMVSQTIEIHQLLDKVVHVPVVQVVRFHRSFISPSWRRGSFPWSRLFVGS